MGQLIQVATTTITSNTSSVTLTGINDDSVYVLFLNNVAPSSDNNYLAIRFTESGTPNSSSNYDRANLFMYPTGTSFGLAGTNENAVNITCHTNGTGTSETTNGIFHIYNAQNSSEFTYLSAESTCVDHNNRPYGSPGGLTLTTTSAVDGVQLFYGSNSIASGTFSLYKIL